MHSFILFIYAFCSFPCSSIHLFGRSCIHPPFVQSTGVFLLLQGQAHVVLSTARCFRAAAVITSYLMQAMHSWRLHQLESVHSLNTSLGLQ